MWSTEIAGTITGQAAAGNGPARRYSGHRRDGRCRCEAVSVGAIQPGDLMVMYGTTMFLFW